MSVVILGGNKCMECQYRNLCKEYNCRIKVFTQMSGTLKKSIGSPDILVLFTSTVSHKMIYGVLDQIKRQNIKIVRSHTSSMAALKTILDQHISADVKK